MDNLEKVIFLIYVKNQLNIKLTKPKHIFFGGASWGCAFYIGIYQGLLEKYGYINDVTIYGVSAGALLALCMVLEMTPKELEEIYLELGNQAEKNGVFLKMTKYHNLALDKILKNDDDYKKVNGKLNIGISIFPNKHLIVNKWNSNQELRHDLHCTFNIPYYCNYKAIKNGKLALDGALTFDQKFYPKDTLFIGINGYHINTDLTTKDCTYPIMNEKFNKIVNDGYNKIKKYQFEKHKPLDYLKGGFIFNINIWWVLRLSTRLLFLK